MVAHHCVLGTLVEQNWSIAARSCPSLERKVVGDEKGETIA